MTDGDPNGVSAFASSAGVVGTTQWTTLLNGGADVMTAPTTAAAAVKTNSRVFSIGVGPALTNEAAKSRLTAVSGPTEFVSGSPGTNQTENFSAADWTTADFDQLRESLTDIVAAICGGSLTIEKSQFNTDGEAVEARDWQFHATLTSPPSHRWLTPTGFGSEPTATATTNGDGAARFSWRLIRPGVGGNPAHARLRIREVGREGFQPVIAVCLIHTDANPAGTPHDATRPIDVTVSVDNGAWVTCAVQNRSPVAHLTVVKRLVPADDPDASTCSSTAIRCSRTSATGSSDG